MALVRMSESLKGTIRFKLDRIYKPRVEQAESSFNQSWGIMVYSAVMAPHMSTISTVDSRFFRRVSELVLSGVKGQTPLSRTRYDISPSSVWFMSFNNGESIYPGVRYQYSGLILDPVEVTDPKLKVVIDEMTAYTKRCEMVAADYLAARQSLNSVLDNNTTLAGALKDWPGLWELLDKSTQDRHLSKATRSETPEKTVDTSGLTKLTSEFAAKRITGGK